MNRTKRIEAAARADARREREDSFPRLARELPGLEALSIRIAEGIPGSITEHVRHVMVASAPALFESRCATCSDGVHDYTDELLRALKSRSTPATGESPCNGLHAAGPCTCVLRYNAIATFSK